MTTNTHSQPAASQQGLDAPVEEVSAPNADAASEMEIAALQNQINEMNAQAQRIENEIAMLLNETGGEGANSSEVQHARQQAREMHNVADAAKAALTNAPTDPKTGRKIISAKKVVNLSISIGGFIIGGEKESGAITTAATETESKVEAVHEKVAAKAALTEKDSTSVCARAAACVAPAPKRFGWVSDSIEQAQDFSARVTSGWSQRLHGLRASVSSMYAGILHADPIGAISHAGHVVAEKFSLGIAIAKGAAHSTLVVISEKYHAGKVMVVTAFSAINPFTEKNMELVQKTVHEPIVAVETAMERAMAQAKALIPHSLPHLSMPHLADFIPSSTPFGQGVTSRMAFGY